jgi:hypothetical protein
MKLNLTFLTGPIEIENTILAVGEMGTATVVTLREAEFPFSSFARFTKAVMLPIIMETCALGAAHNVGQAVII